MKRILVPTDFSPESINAADYAASFAHAFGAGLHLIHVIKPSVLLDDSILASVMITQAEIVEESKQLIEKEVKRLSTDYLVTVTHQVEEGYPAETVIEVAEGKGTDLIVMGMKGKGKSNSLLGSTTTTVIRKANHPVLVIPLKATCKPIQHITLAYDFDSDIATTQYKVLQSILEKFNAELNIVNVQRKPELMNQDAMVGKMRTNVAFSKSNPDFHVVTEKNVEDGILKFTRETPADIIAMIAHRHSFIERLFGNVHTRSMSYLTEIPLLIIQGK